MNMKKAIASLLAGVVAVSAMATIAVSAAEKEQAADTITYDFMSKGWNIVWNVSNEATSTITGSGAAAEATGIDIVPGAYKVAYAEANGYTVSGIKITLEGKAPITESFISKTYEVKDNTIKFVPAGAVAQEGEIPLGNFTVITSIKVSATMTSGEYRSKNNATTDSAVSMDLPMSIKMADGTKLGGFDWLLSGKAGTVEKMKDAAAELVLNSDGIAMNSIVKNLGYDMITKLSNTKGATIKFYFTVAEGDTTVPGLPITDPGLDYMPTNATIKDLAIAPAQTYLAENQLGEMVDDGIWTVVDKWLISFSGKVQGAANVEDGVATFDWDSIVAGSTLSMSSLTICNDIVIGCKPAWNGTKLPLEKIVIDIPAKTVEDITLGAGTEDETPAPVDTPAASEEAPADTEATEGTSNPSTGNAPVALAVIPVALVAAAIVAKKRG